MKALPLSWNKDGRDGSQSTIRNAPSKQGGANDGVAAVMADENTHEDQVLAVSSSQVSVRGGKKKLRSTEHRWIQKLMHSYKSLRATSKALVAQQANGNTKEAPDPNGKAD